MLDFGGDLLEPLQLADTPRHRVDQLLSEQAVAGTHLDTMDAAGRDAQAFDGASSDGASGAADPPRGYAARQANSMTATDRAAKR